MLGSLFHPLGITQITSAAPHLPPAYLYLWGTLQISPRNFNHQYFVTSTRNGMAPNNLITELYIILSPPLTAVHRPACGYLERHTLADLLWTTCHLRP